MKFIALFPFVLLLLLCSCKDIAEVDPTEEKLKVVESETPPLETPPSAKVIEPSVEQGFAIPAASTEPNKPNPATTPYKKYFFPFDRTITNSRNQTINAQITAKGKGHIAFKKIGEPREFVVPISSLSPEDIAFYSDLDDGGRYDDVVERIAIQKRLSGRSARWHSFLGAAKDESKTLGIPTVVLVLIYDHELSDTIRKLFFNEEFKKWADNNVCLCLLQVDDPKSNKTSSSNSHGNLKDAHRLGISRFSKPHVLVNKGIRKFPCPLGEMTDTRAAIQIIENALIKEKDWQTIIQVF
ncbi:MAG: hypothetical protein P1V20_00840 [Verrucomicrobiales bacterium]|nr:hypothetical protein [Verrucomicrobiales bacterium]